jgi:hypothetical protein
MISNGCAAHLKKPFRSAYHESLSLLLSNNLEFNSSTMTRQAAWPSDGKEEAKARR